jgi:biopolymer transport protein ExbD
VLLIIFMVITPLTPHGLNTLVPQPPPPNMPPPPPNQDPTVVVEIKADHSMAINSDPVKPEDLQNRLADIFKTRAQKVLFIKGDKDLEYRYVAQAIDSAKGADPDMKVGIMTPKVEAGQ